uniref:Kelch domain containing 7B n=1 Tax=Bos indicus x Bos taurus TaxID=30522 RepID=A0A4W2BWK1_BOBOX
MAQSASEAGGLAWGWDGDADEDWEDAALTLLALAVVAATALALHWFGSAQDQEAGGPASTALCPSQVEAAGPALPVKHKVSGAVEGHSSVQGKPGPPGHGQGSPAAAGAQDQEPLGGGSLAAAASPPLKTPAGEGASGGVLGPPETLRRKGKEAHRSGSALPCGSKGEGSSAPLLIHFTPRDPGREVEVWGEAGGVRGTAPDHRIGRDSRPWQQGRGSPASRGQSPGSRWGQVDSGRSGYRRRKLDALSLGSVVSVWDAVGAASCLPSGSQGLLFPQEPPPLCSLQTRPLMGVSERGLGESGPQATRGLALDSGATAGHRQGLGEKQEEARKLMMFLQRPGGWGVAEGPRKSRASVVALPRWLDLGSCLEALAFAQQHGDPGLAQETYAWMSDNLLHVLRDPSLYRQLSGADRERIVSLRTSRGPAVLGALVLPGLYRASRSELTRGSPAAEALAVGPAALPPPAYLHVFHPGENSWRPLTKVPQEAPLRGCGLCTLHNYLFLAGGVRGSGAEAVCCNEVFCYNPLTNIWSQVRPMQQARAQLKLVALDGLLYAIGGECLYSMECYDPRTDAWSPRAPLPAGAFPVAHDAVACQGDIYVTGGHLFHRLLRYRPTKDAWDECPYSASHRRSSDMVALGGFLYRFDLLRGVGAAVMRYNTVTSSWSRAASLPLPAPAPLRCAVLGNTIYCLNHQVTATFTVSEGTAQFQAKELQPFPLETKGVLCPFTLTLPARGPLQTAL